MIATGHIFEQNVRAAIGVHSQTFRGWFSVLCLAALIILTALPTAALAQTVAAPPAEPAVAAPPVKPIKLEMPVRCTQGADCWIVNYVDDDPGPGVKDYACGRASYNGHKGTDIAIVDARRMRQGVNVYASAAGTVVGTRDEMRDVDFNLIGGPKAVAGKECGNGVLLAHENGWTTQYCHMLQGSIRVTRGDSVEAGQPLGQVGTSGLSEFPHIHLQVKSGDTIVDPFVGLHRDKECGVGKSPLWKTDVLLSFLYKPTAVYNAGFSSTTPNARIAREGLYAEDTL
ncbi:MAG: M23 family metallopeptidase, partial [Alphaproteobacteria bacterium]